MYTKHTFVWCHCLQASEFSERSSAASLDRDPENQPASLSRLSGQYQESRAGSQDGSRASRASVRSQILDGGDAAGEMTLEGDGPHGAQGKMKLHRTSFGSSRSSFYYFTRGVPTGYCLFTGNPMWTWGCRIKGPVSAKSRTVSVAIHSPVDVTNKDSLPHSTGRFLHLCLLLRILRGIAFG